MTKTYRVWYTFADDGHEYAALFDAESVADAQKQLRDSRPDEHFLILRVECLG